VKSIDQDQLGDQDGGSLVMDGLPAIMSQIGDLQHRKVSEKGRVVKRPF
jgi:hypothetical protein